LQRGCSAGGCAKQSPTSKECRWQHRFIASSQSHWTGIVTTFLSHGAESRNACARCWNFPASLFADDAVCFLLLYVYVFADECRNLILIRVGHESAEALPAISLSNYLRTFHHLKREHDLCLEFFHAACTNFNMNISSCSEFHARFSLAVRTVCE